MVLGKLIYLRLPALVVEVLIVLIYFLYRIYTVFVMLKFIELEPGVFIAHTISYRHLMS